MSYTDPLFDDPLFDDQTHDSTPRAKPTNAARLRTVSSIAALPSFDAHSPFNSPNMFGLGAKAAFLTSPAASRTGAPLSFINTPQQAVRIADSYSAPHFGNEYAATDEGMFDQAAMGLGVALPEASPPITSINWSSMRVYGVPQEKATKRSASRAGQYISYPQDLPTGIAAAHASNENAPLIPVPQRAASPRPFAQPLSPRMQAAASQQPEGRALTPRAASRSSARNKKQLIVKTDVVASAEGTPRSPKRVKSMPAMREPRTPPHKHAPLPMHQPRVPFNSPDVYATPSRQAQMPFSFGELFEMGLSEGSNLDLGGYEGPKSPSALSYGMESGLSSATSASMTFDFSQLGLPSDEPSLLPTPYLMPSSVLSTPSSVGCQSPDHHPINPMDALFQQQGPAQTLYDALLSPQAPPPGHAAIPTMQDNMGWAMPATSVPMSRGFQSLDGVVSSASSGMPLQSPPAPRRTGRAVSKKRSRADFLAGNSGDDDDDYDDRGGGDDDEFVLSSEDVEYGEEESEDGDYRPNDYLSPVAGRMRRQFSDGFVPEPAFSFADRPKMSRVVSEPGQPRLRPGPKPKKSVPNLRVLASHSTGPNLNVVREALCRVGADPDLIYAADVCDEDDEEPYQGTLNRAVIRALYQTQGTSGSRRYKCLIEGCDKAFPRKSAIESHIQMHLEDKPFVCTLDDCGAAFVRQHDLRRHMKIHSGIKTHQCACGKGFARGDALQRHRQRGICVGSSVPRRQKAET